MDEIGELSTRLFCQTTALQLLPNSSSTSALGSRGIHVFPYGITTSKATAGLSEMRPWRMSGTETSGDVYQPYASYQQDNYTNLKALDLPLHFDYLMINLIIRNNSNLGCYVKPYIFSWKSTSLEASNTDFSTHLNTILNREDLVNTEGMYSLGLEHYPEVQSTFRVKKLAPYIHLPGQVIQMKEYHPAFNSQLLTSDFVFHETEGHYNQAFARYIVLDIIGLPIHQSGNTIGTATNVGYGFWTLDCIVERVTKARTPIIRSLPSEIVQVAVNNLTAIDVTLQEFLPAVNPDPVVFKN